MIEKLLKEFNFLGSSLCGCECGCCETSCDNLSYDDRQKCLQKRADRAQKASDERARKAAAAAEAAARLGTLTYDATDGYLFEGKPWSLTIPRGEKKPGERTISLGDSTIFCHGFSCSPSSPFKSGSYHTNFRVVARLPEYNGSGAVIPYADGKRYPDDVYAEVYEHTKAGFKVVGAHMGEEVVAESSKRYIAIDPSKMTLDPYNTGDEKGKTLLFIVGPKLDASNFFAAPDRGFPLIAIKIPIKS